MISLLLVMAMKAPGWVLRIKFLSSTAWLRLVMVMMTVMMILFP